MAVSSLLLDTNVFTALLQGKDGAIRICESADKIYFPFIVIAELYAGFRVGSKETANRKKLRDFLDTSDSMILYPDAETMEHYASIYQILRRSGKPIPTNDLWIAALSLQYGLTLFTLDAHFSFIDSLSIISIP